MRMQVLGILLLTSAALFYTENAVDHHTVAPTTLPTLLASHQARPDGLVVDSETVYWANCGNYVSGMATVISQSPQFNAFLYDSQRLSYTAGITFTPVFTTYLPLISSPGPPPDGAIMALSKSQGISYTLASGLACPTSLTADTDSLFWLIRQGNVGLMQFTIFRMSKSGGQPMELISYEGVNGSLAVDETYVYWREYDGVVMRLPKAGGGTPQAAPVPALVFDGPTAYWRNSNDDLIQSGKDGGSAVTLVNGSDLAQLGLPGDSYVSIRAIFPRPSAIYFTVSIDNQPGITGCRDDRTVLMKLPKDSSEYEQVAYVPGLEVIALVTEPFVYFSGGGCVDGIVKINLNTQSTETIVSWPESASALADDALYVYWADYGNGWIKRVGK